MRMALERHVLADGDEKAAEQRERIDALERRVCRQCGLVDSATYETGQNAGGGLVPQTGAATWERATARRRRGFV